MGVSLFHLERWYLRPFCWLYKINFKKNIRINISFIKSPYYLFNTAFVFEDISLAEKVVDISEKERDDIIDALIAAETDKWEYNYISKESDKETSWNFGMEFLDGTIMSFNGKGGAPDSYPKFRDTIFEIARK